MKFSIRDLLLVTVIVALVVGWWVDHRRSAGTLREVLREQAEEKQKALEEAAAQERAWQRQRLKVLSGQH